MPFVQSCFEVLKLESSSHPFHEEVAHRLSVEHVSDATQLLSSVVSGTHFLCLLDLLLDGEVVLQVLVLVDAVLGHADELGVHLFVGAFFPLHERVMQTALVFVDESDFHALHGVRVVVARLLPNLHRPVRHVAVAQVALA